MTYVIYIIVFFFSAIYISIIIIYSLQLYIWYEILFIYLYWTADKFSLPNILDKEKKIEIFKTILETDIFENIIFETETKTKKC